MKHCIRIRTVCGEKVDLFSGTQVVANHPSQHTQDEIESIQRAAMRTGVCK